MHNSITKQERKLLHDLMSDSGVTMMHCVNILRDNDWNYAVSLKKALQRNPKCPKCGEHMKRSIIKVMDASYYYCKEHGKWTLWHRSGEFIQQKLVIK